MPITIIVIATTVNTMLLTLVYMRRFRGLRRRTYQINPLSPMVWAVNTVLAMVFLAVSGNFVLMAISSLTLVYEVLLVILGFMAMRGHKLDWKIKRSDHACFVLALGAVVSFYLTGDAIVGATVLFVGGIFGELPQLRKAYTAPKTDNITFYIIGLARNVVAVGTLQHLDYIGYSRTLFWVVISLAEIGWIVYCQNRQAWQVRHAVRYAINFCPVESDEPETEVYSAKIATDPALNSDEI